MYNELKARRAKRGMSKRKEELLAKYRDCEAMLNHWVIRDNQEEVQKYRDMMQSIVDELESVLGVEQCKK